jgi:hypothetical protein
VRTSVKFVTGLAVICLAACSGSQKADSDIARAQSLRSELANSGLPSGSQSVVSDLEVPPLAKLTAARAGNTADPKGGALGATAKSGVSAVAGVNRKLNDSKASIDKASENLAIDNNVGIVSVKTPILDVVVPTSTSVAADPLPVTLPAPVPIPMEPASAGEGSGENGTASGPSVERPPRATPRPRPESPPARPPGIIIRGGTTTRDPCAVHRPGPAAGGVLINNRLPTRGPPVTRGGSTFPGGIR